MDEIVRLYLVAGVEAEIEFWDVGFTSTTSTILDSKNNYLECYRNELIGIDAAKDIKSIIISHLEILRINCINDGYDLTVPLKGISFDIPLYIVENIFDFWFDTYKNSSLWNKCRGAFDIYNKICNSSYLLKDAFKGDTLKCFNTIDELINYRPPISTSSKSQKESMW